MLPGAMFLIFLLVSASLGSGNAQISKGSSAPEAAGRGQPAPAPPGLQHNVGAMAELMGDIHRMLHLGPLTPQEAGEVSDIMTRLGIMMKEMSGPQAERFQSRHQRQLQEMKKQVEEIKARLKSRKL
ncbi:MAG: hypothetical protein AB1424_01320 [Thermodesulfobacteriota bacterium]